MLTYETLRKIVTDEKNTNKICKLPEDFFKHVKEYLDKKGEMSGSKEDKWEFESAKRLLQDLLELRERKILTLGMFHIRSGVVSDDLTEEERGFFDRIVSVIKDFHIKRKGVTEGEPEDLTPIAILSPTEKFVGVNLKEYGPFREGDIVTLPKENAKLLVEKKMARKMEI